MHCVSAWGSNAYQPTFVDTAALLDWLLLCHKIRSFYFCYSLQVKLKRERERKRKKSVQFIWNLKNTKGNHSCPLKIDDHLIYHWHWWRTEFTSQKRVIEITLISVFWDCHCLWAEITGWGGWENYIVAFVLISGSRTRLIMKWPFIRTRVNFLTLCLYKKRDFSDNKTHVRLKRTAQCFLCVCVWKNQNNISCSYAVPQYPWHLLLCSHNVSVPTMWAEIGLLSTLNEAVLTLNP